MRGIYLRRSGRYIGFGRIERVLDELGRRGRIAEAPVVAR